MSKRTRGGRGTRPGTRRPISRPAGARPGRPSPPDPTTLPAPTPLEVAPEVAEDVVEKRPAAAAADARRATHVANPRPRAKAGSVLAARAASEYVYVGQDIRRIVVVSAVLFGLMLLAWLLIAVLRVIPLEFY